MLPSEVCPGQRLIGRIGPEVDIAECERQSPVSPSCVRA